MGKRGAEQEGEIPYRELLTNYPLDFLWIKQGEVSDQLVKDDFSQTPGTKKSNFRFRAIEDDTQWSGSIDPDYLGPKKA
jgi:hypothetical protein